MVDKEIRNIDAKGSFKLNGKYYYLDPLKKQVLDFIKSDLRKNWDSWNVYSGREGTGKSVSAIQDCMYVTDGKFNVDDICFTPEQLIKRVQTQRKYGAVLYDEAITGYMSQTGMNKISAELTKLAAQCRARNLFVCIAIPSFFDLNKYIAIHRTDYLCYVDAPPDDKGERIRGTFYYFNRREKQTQYLKGKKTYWLSKKSAVLGKFRNWTGIDMDAYEKKKFEALQLMGNKQFTSEKQRNLLLKKLVQMGANQEQLGDLIGLTGSVVGRAIKTLDEMPS